MVIELRGDDDTVTPPSGLERLLGPSQDRYFASGYREVRYELPSAVRCGSREVDVVGRVLYPARWSAADNGLVRVAHLSSIDAVVLPLLAMEHLASLHDRRRLSRLRIASICLRGGTKPWLALGAVPVKFTVTETAAECRLSGVTGNIRLDTVAIADRWHQSRSFTAEPGHPSVYGGLFQQTSALSTVKNLDAAHGELNASHVIEYADALSSAPGIEANQWPAPTIVDYLVTMGQLAQALVYASAGTARSEAGPLWMRTMKIDIDEPPSRLPVSFDTTTRLLRDRVLGRGAERIHDVLVESVATSGVRARSTLAYKDQGA